MATDWTAEANTEAYYLMEQASAAAALDGKGNNTLTQYDEGSATIKDEVNFKEGAASCLYSGASNYHLLTDANLNAGFPGKDSGGATGSFSFGGWVKIDTDANAGLMGKWNDYDAERSFCVFYATWANGFVGRIYTSTGEKTILGGTDPADDFSAFYHVVVVFDAENDLLYLYVNGSSDAVAVAATGTLNLGDREFRVGQQGAGSNLDGNLDEAFIIKQALSAQEVSDIHEFGFAGSVTEYSLVCDGGSFSLGGIATALLKSSVIVPDPGSFIFTGQAATVGRLLTLDAGVGAYALDGQVAGLLKSSVIVADAASYLLVGQVVALLKSGKIDIEAASYILTGQDITLTKGRAIDIGAGSYILTGLDVDLIYTPGEGVYRPVYRPRRR